MYLIKEDHLNFRIFFTRFDKENKKIKFDREEDGFIHQLTNDYAAAICVGDSLKIKRIGLLLDLYAEKRVEEASIDVEEFIDAIVSRPLKWFDKSKRLLRKVERFKKK